MKTLLLFRHAKSDWSDPQLADIDRPLNKRGRQAAAVMARHLRTCGLTPQLILCSSAVRAEQTLAALYAEMGNTLEVRIERALYMASPNTMLALVRDVPDSVGSLMIIGHNPGLQNFALDLIGGGAEEQWGELAHKFPTAALAVIDFDLDHWTDVKARRGKLIAFRRPKAEAAA